ncbi:MAG: phosphoglycerate dehydrogenase, partial [Verrucomicrobiota bacterium]|nr:phosphoglycerate dehydrogenase [Verrucomicrobiota bacterium]
MQTQRILIADPVSERGVEELSRDGALEVVSKIGLPAAELIKLIPDFHGLVVRSETKITKEVLEAATKLRVVGRAGVGVDNVDVETATRRGVIVMNAPGGNTVSTAEHAF